MSSVINRMLKLCEPHGYFIPCPYCEGTAVYPPITACPRCKAKMIGGICQNYGCEHPIGREEKQGLKQLKPLPPSPTDAKARGKGVRKGN